MTAVVDAAIPLEVPAPPPARPRVLLIGTSLVTGAIIMLFAGLFGIYLTTRTGVVHAHKAWLPVGTTIPLTPATMALFTFILSLVTMQWSVYAVRNNDRQHAILALILTILFGICAINSVTFLYTQSNLGIAGSAAGTLIYVISGAHIAMTVAALVFAALMTFRTLGGQYSGRDSDGILAASMFWTATVAVYAVIWYAIFVTK